MKARSKHASGNAWGFWARVRSTLEAMEMSSGDVMESRIQRLEIQVARLTAGRLPHPEEPDSDLT